MKIKSYKVVNKVNRNYRNVIIRGRISFVYIRILKGECKMSNVTIQKRGKYYQYKFEVAKVDDKRKFINKSGFDTKDEAIIDIISRKLITIIF